MHTKPLTLYQRGMTRWHKPPPNPHLNRNKLHLWLINLEISKVTNGFLKVLSPDEKARFSRLVGPHRRAAFAVGRASLRLILAKYLELPPEEIRFGYQKMGKPYIANSFREPEIQFNLSHCGPWMILGICYGINLGIDIERIRPVNKKWALENLFSAEERDYIDRFSKDDCDRAFIAHWTKKEAAAKAAGIGLAGVNIKKGSKNAPAWVVPDDDILWLSEEPFCYLSFESPAGYITIAALRTVEKPAANFFEFSLDTYPEFEPSKNFNLSFGL